MRNWVTLSSGSSQRLVLNSLDFILNRSFVPQQVPGCPDGRSVFLLSHIFHFQVVILFKTAHRKPKLTQERRQENQTRVADIQSMPLFLFHPVQEAQNLIRLHPN